MELDKRTRISSLAGENQSSETGFPNASPRFLVAEDEWVVADICRRVLTGAGFEVDIATNGKSAQQMVKNNRYDYCMIDVKMPVMNGEEFYHWLREEQPYLADRVFFTTGDVINQCIEAFLEQCERPFLPKPFTPDGLMRLVKLVVDESRCPA